MPDYKPKSIAFQEAARSYLEHGGETRYLDKIISHFGDIAITEITPFDVKQMALTLYPESGGFKNSTRNRQALSPTRSVIIHSYERGWCNLMRLRKFKEERPKRKSPASAAWLQLFVRQCDKDGLPHLAALVLFMSLTGARISEAVRLEWPQVDLPARKATLLRTKTSVNSERHLPDALADRIRLLWDLPDRKDFQRVFRFTSRYSVNERIRAVCDRAGISYKSPHVCGRHSFATNAIAMGMDVASAMEAGDWKSSEVFIETYVHPRNASRRVADSFTTIDFSPDL